jgi:hypothetical protein
MLPRILKFPDGKLTTSRHQRSLLISMRKWYPRALYPKRRPQIYSRCSFSFTDSLGRSDVVADSSMVAPRSFRSLIPQWIHSDPCTNGLLLLLIVYAWSRPESAMVAVRYLLLIRETNVPDPIVVSSGKPSEVYSKCLQEVQTISCATLFAPVLRVEAVQAMSA